MQLLDHARYQKQTVKVSSNSRIRKGIDLHMQTLSSLLSNVDSGFSIDWNQISALDVQHRHSPYSCEAMWLVYLHPNLNRNEWTTLEDDALLVAAKENKMRNWQAIADSVPHRSDYQCFVRVQTTLRFYIEPSNNVKWTQQENERLCKIVELNTSNGVTNWSQVVEHFPDRSKSTLIGRYLYVLHPSISHGKLNKKIKLVHYSVFVCLSAPFTPKEDIMLYAAFQEYKGKFNCFPRTLFPNRSLAQLRTRYNNVLAQRNKTDSWSVEDDKKLMAFVTTNGTSQWLNCAKHLGNHTRTSCRTRFLVIKRFLEQHPNATIDDLPRRKSNKNAQVTAENWGQRLLEWTENPDSLSDTEPKAKRPKRLTGYVGTLRGMDVHIYEYFKYAYNLRLQSPAAPIALPKDEINLHIVVNALRFRPPEIQTKIKKLVKSVFLPQQLNRCYSRMLHQLPPLLPLCKDRQPMLLPPNWSTMMGFRAMCILSVHCRNHSENVASKHRTVDYDESHAEVQLFRQRLRTVFYRTTLLSRLEASVFKQLPAVLTQSPRPDVEYTPSENEKRMENSTSRRSTRNSKIKSELDEKSPKRESPSD